MGGGTGEKGEKMEGIERKVGWNTQFSQSHFPHFPEGSKAFPAVQTNVPHSPTGKWEFLPLTDPHRHSG